MYTEITGRSGLPSPRAGFSDCAAFGFGFMARDTWSGCLDAPHFIPQGSVRVSNTIKHAPHLSLAHRDGADGKPLGAQHDGPERPELWEGMCK